MKAAVAIFISCLAVFLFMWICGDWSYCPECGNLYWMPIWG